MSRLLETLRGADSLTAVNYHWTSARDAGSLDAQFAWLSANFHCLGESELLDRDEGRRGTEKPGLVVTFDDGYRNNLYVAAPLLAKYGMTGWFFVIVNASLRSDGEPNPEIPHVGDVRDTMILEELQQLRRLGHVIGCHTASHANLGTCRPTDLHDEVVGAGVRLGASLDATVTSFAFPYGTMNSFTPDAVALVHSRYPLVFNSFPEWRGCRNSAAIGRYCLEASWSVSEMRLRIAGPLSLKYLRARRRYAKARSSGDCDLR